MGRIAERMTRIGASGIRKVFDMASHMENPINLSIGQPDFETPRPVREAVIEAIESGKNRYTQTQGIPELRQAVTEKLASFNNVQTEPDRVLITSGVMGGIDLSLLALLDPGDEILIPDPYFVAIPYAVKMVGATPVGVDTYDDFLPDVASLKKSITGNTKALYLNTPCNPTGRVYPPALIRKIAEVAERHELIVIADEIYDRFTYGREHLSIGSLYEDTITLGGFSKSHAIPGWRIGYATGPEDVMAEMNKLQVYTYVCAPSIAQHALAKTLNTDITREVRRYGENKDILMHELEGFDIIEPEGSFYCFPRAPWGTATEFVAEAIKNDLLIIPGAPFSARDTHFRISFAAPKSEIRRGIEVLNRLAAQGGPSPDAPDRRDVSASQKI